jgi:glycosyltransferase involved in cell wall biosynthesis
MRKWKILMVFPVDSRTGGVEELAREYLKSDKLKKHLDLLNLSIDRHIKYYGTFSFKALLISFKHIYEFVVKISSSQIKGVFFPLPFRFLTFLKKYFFSLIAALAGKKIFVFYYKRYAFRKLYNNHFLLRPLIKSFLNLADKIIILSDDIFETDFEGLVKKEKIEVVFSGMNSKFFRPNDEDMQERARKKRIDIVFVGRLTEEKGVVDLVKAFLDLKERKGFENVYLNLIGGENTIDNSWVKEICEKGNNRINFLGVKTGQEKVMVLKKADIFVFPSYIEGMSIALLEAMAAGLPIVTCDKGSAQYFIKNGVNGFVSRAGDVESLKNNIERLIKDAKLRKKISYNNCELAKEFDIIKATSLLYDIFKSNIC